MSDNEETEDFLPNETGEPTTLDIAREAARVVAKLKRELREVEGYGIIDTKDILSKVNSHRASMYRNRGYLVDSKAKTQAPSIFMNTVQEQKYIGQILFHAYMIRHYYADVMSIIGYPDEERGD